MAPRNSTEKESSILTTCMELVDIDHYCAVCYPYQYQIVNAGDDRSSKSICQVEHLFTGQCIEITLPSFIEIEQSYPFHMADGYGPVILLNLSTRRNLSDDIYTYYILDLKGFPDVQLKMVSIPFDLNAVPRVSRDSVYKGRYFNDVGPDAVVGVGDDVWLYDKSEIDAQAIRLNLSTGKIEDVVVLGLLGEFSLIDFIPTVSPSGFLLVGRAGDEHVAFYLYNGKSIHTLRVSTTGVRREVNVFGAGKYSFVSLTVPPPSYRHSLRDYDIFRVPAHLLIDFITSISRSSVDIFYSALFALQFPYVSLHTSHDLGSIDTFWNRMSPLFTTTFYPASFPSSKTTQCLSDILDFENGNAYSLKSLMNFVQSVQCNFRSAVYLSSSMLLRTRFANYLDLSDFTQLHK